MADEAVLSVPGLGKLEYNLRHYMNYVSRIQEKVVTLNQSGKDGGEGVGLGNCFSHPVYACKLSRYAGCVEEVTAWK